MPIPLQQNSPARFRSPLLGTYLWGKEREILREAFLNFSQPGQDTLVPWVSSEASWVESAEIGTARRIQGSAQRCHQCQAEELPHLHRLALHVKWTHQKLYIIGNDLGQTKVCGAGAGEHTLHHP